MAALGRPPAEVRDRAHADDCSADRHPLSRSFSGGNRERCAGSRLVPAAGAELGCHTVVMTDRDIAGDGGERGDGARQRRIGVMGGTFDPIHNGHLVAGSEVAALFELDEVVFVPTGQPWQKDRKPVSPAEDRYLMTVIATASNPQFSVSRVDIERPGPTYTVDTLRDIRAIYGSDVRLYFITGADALSAMLSWKDADGMFARAHFVGVTRPGYSLSVSHLPSDVASLVEIPALAISSTSCRERVAAGRPVWYLMPDGVVRYIDKRGLYRSDGPADGAGYR